MNSKRRSKIREQELAIVLAGINDKINRVDLYRSCLSCMSFDDRTELCKKWSMRPPAKIIANGCDDYFDVNDIPF